MAEPQVEQPLPKMTWVERAGNGEASKNKPDFFTYFNNPEVLKSEDTLLIEEFFRHEYGVGDASGMKELIEMSQKDFDGRVGVCKYLFGGNRLKPKEKILLENQIDNIVELRKKAGIEAPPEKPKTEQELKTWEEVVNQPFEDSEKVNGPVGVERGKAINFSHLVEKYSGWQEKHYSFRDKDVGESLLRKLDEYFGKRAEEDAMRAIAMVAKAREQAELKRKLPEEKPEKELVKQLSFTFPLSELDSDSRRQAEDFLRLWKAGKVDKVEVIFTPNKPDKVAGIVIQGKNRWGEEELRRLDYETLLGASVAGEKLTLNPAFTSEQLKNWWEERKGKIVFKAKSDLDEGAVNPNVEVITKSWELGKILNEAEPKKNVRVEWEEKDLTERERITVRHFLGAWKRCQDDKDLNVVINYQEGKINKIERIFIKDNGSESNNIAYVEWSLFCKATIKGESSLKAEMSPEELKNWWMEHRGLIFRTSADGDSEVSHPDILEIKLRPVPVTKKEEIPVPEWKFAIKKKEPVVV